MQQNILSKYLLIYKNIHTVIHNSLCNTPQNTRTQLYSIAYSHS